MFPGRSLVVMAQEMDTGWIGDWFRPSLHANVSMVSGILWCTYWVGSSEPLFGDSGW